MYFKENNRFFKNHIKQTRFLRYKKRLNKKTALKQSQINTWKNKDKYTRQAKKLAKLFHANFTNMQSSTHPVSGINPTQLNNILLGGPKQI